MVGSFLIRIANRIEPMKVTREELSRQEGSGRGGTGKKKTKGKESKPIEGKIGIREREGGRERDLHWKKTRAERRD